MSRRLPIVLALVLAALLLVSACDHNSPTAPDTTAGYGTLAGTVTIGPNCPASSGSNPCPTSPEAYAARKILVFDAQRTKLLFTLDINSLGAYIIRLPAATYVVDLQSQATLDRTSDLPKSVTISRNTVTRLEVSIDTGIR